MLPDLLERYAHLDSPIHRMGARTKILLAGLFILIAVLTPTRWRHAFLVEASLVAFAFTLSRLPWRMLGVRLLVFVPFVLMLSFGVPLSRGLAGGWDLMGAVLARSILSFATLVILASTTRFDALLAGLRQLGVPKLLVAVLGMTIRYLFVLIGELENMQRARLARTAHAPRWKDWLILPNLVGCLFLRSIDRAERVHQAMLSRGWTGEPRTLDDP